MFSLYKNKFIFIIFERYHSEIYLGKDDEIRTQLRNRDVNDDEIDLALSWLNKYNHNVAEFGINKTVIYTKFEDNNERLDRIYKIKEHDFYG